MIPGMGVEATANLIRPQVHGSNRAFMHSTKAWEHANSAEPVPHRQFLPIKMPASDVEET